MDKKILAVITAAFLVAPISLADAATNAPRVKVSAAPKAKSTTAPEGSAKHEMGETSQTQANEAKKPKATVTTKKVIVKKPAKASPTPTA